MREEIKGQNLTLWWGRLQGRAHDDPHPFLTLPGPQGAALAPPHLPVSNLPWKQLSLAPRLWPQPATCVRETGSRGLGVGRDVGSPTLDAPCWLRELGWRTDGQGRDFRMGRRLPKGPFPQDAGSEAVWCHPNTCPQRGLLCLLGSGWKECEPQALEPGGLWPEDVAAVGGRAGCGRASRC